MKTPRQTHVFVLDIPKSGHLTFDRRFFYVFSQPITSKNKYYYNSYIVKVSWYKISQNGFLSIDISNILKY